MGEFVGIDLHKRHTVMVRMDEDGNRLEKARFDSTPVTLAAALARAGASPEVVVEATGNWYWAYDTLAAEGARVHLAHPGGLRWGDRRVKNDVNDATDLVTMVRLGVLPEAWPAPPQLRELRELVRYRAKLVQLRTALKAQLASTLAKQATSLPRATLAGPHRHARLAELGLTGAYDTRSRSLLGLIDAYTAEITRLGRDVEGWLGDDVGYQAILAIKGVGPILAAVFVAEIGDIHRFRRPEQLASWAGLTPRLRESDTKSHRGHMTKQGSGLVRWAAIEAISRARDTAVAPLYARVQARRGTNIARVAAARALNRPGIVGDSPVLGPLRQAAGVSEA